MKSGAGFIKECERLLKETLRYWPGLLCAAGLAVLLQATAHTVCAINAVTGLPCPACGTTRALLFMLGGEVMASLRSHPLMPVLALYSMSAMILRLWRGCMPRWWNAVTWGLLAVYLAVYILRMLLWFPDTEPMVINEAAYWQRIWHWCHP